APLGRNCRRRSPQTLYNSLMSQRWLDGTASASLRHGRSASARSLQERNAMALLTTNHPSNVQARLEELERRNQLLEAEIERLRVYKDYAYTDALTEIPNRRFYYERLLQEIARARRSGSPLTLALVDLDLFKEINDDVGHRGGDQVLKFFSQFVRVNLRQEDIVCRIGGDEFAIILPDTSAENATIFFDRIRSKLDQIEISIDG